MLLAEQGADVFSQKYWDLPVFAEQHSHGRACLVPVAVAFVGALIRPVGGWLADKLRRDYGNLGVEFDEAIFLRIVSDVSDTGSHSSTLTQFDDAIRRQKLKRARAVGRIILDRDGGARELGSDAAFSAEPKT
jgi:hypothetical protein